MGGRVGPGGGGFSDFVATIYGAEIPGDALVFEAMEQLGLDHAEDHGIKGDMTFVQVCQGLQSPIDTQKEPTSGE